MSDRIALGIIRKAHGVRGEASVELWSESLDRLDGIKTVTLASPDESRIRDASIEAVRVHAGRLLVKFAGIDSPEAVQHIRNWTIEVPGEDAAALGEDEYYLHDLAGLTLVDRDGVVRGTVKEAYEGGGGILLDVATPDGRHYDLPFAAGICVEIDLAQKRIVVELPEGIEDLAALPAIEDEARK